MKRLILVSALALAGCPSDEAGNPPVLWLALDGSETQDQADRPRADSRFEHPAWDPVGLKRHPYSLKADIPAGHLSRHL